MLRITKGGRGAGPAISTKADWIRRGAEGLFTAPIWQPFHAAKLRCCIYIFHFSEIKIATAG